MAINYSNKKEAEDNLRYAEKKSELQKTNNLNTDMLLVKLTNPEKKTLARLKFKQEQSDIFGPLSTKEEEKLNELLLKEKQDE
tara:strand:+ start:106 stop:354 length:249 start_codon:yes stop_codon:yes gene_type:complete